MSVAADHRTVNLWPVPARPRKDPAVDPLAAITSRYRRGRAGIIAGETAPPAVATHLPTVPVALLPRSPLPEVPQSPPADRAPTLWSRVLGTRRPARRGRHSPPG